MIDSHTTLHPGGSATAAPRFSCHRPATPFQAGISSEIIQRVRHGLECRHFYVLGRDELSILCGDATTRRGRERLLEEFAASVEARLECGWNDSTALVTRPQ